MDKRFAMILSATIGAGWMYFGDPRLGRRRCAILRDKFVHLTHRSSFRDHDISGHVLSEWVRAELGGAVSHPRAIDVSAERGRVTLSGAILADEVEGLLRRVASVRGVQNIDNRLETHAQPENVPSLQGQPARRLSGRRLDIWQTCWSPTTRMLAGAAGRALVVYGAGRRDTGGATLSLMGLALLARALTNVEMQRLFGMGTD